MKFKLAAAALALAVLLSLGVARATGWPNAHAESGATDRVAVQPVSARPADPVPQTASRRSAPANDRAVPIGGTTAACAVLLAAIVFRRAARRR